MFLQGLAPNLLGMTKLAHLSDRAVFEISGEDRVAFLQGLVSNDVTLVGPGDATNPAPERAIWAAMLTPQGKWLADFFVFSDGARLLLDVEARQAEMLMKKLGRFRLRARVGIAVTGLVVHAGWDGPVPEGAVADPRREGVGWRVLAPALLAVNATAADYDLHRLRLGLPGGSLDMEAEKTTLLEAGFDDLHGVSWTKGCYMGQELTARTKYRALLKRRLVSVRVEGALPAVGEPVFDGDMEVGTMRSSRGGIGLALLRVEAIGAARLTCGDAILIPHLPLWMETAGG